MKSGLMTRSYDEAAAAVPVERTICSLWCVCVCVTGEKNACVVNICVWATVICVHILSSFVILSQCFEEKTLSMSDLWFPR